MPHARRQPLPRPRPIPQPRDLDGLIAKAMLQPSFKKELLKDFSGTAKRYKVKLTPAQSRAFNKLTTRDWNKIQSVMMDGMVAASACRVK